MAKGVNVKTDGDGEVGVDGLRAEIAELREAVKQLVETRNKMPLALSPETHIQRAMARGSSRRVQDLLHPRAQDSGFQPDDVVQYKQDSDKFAKIGDKKGVILNYMYTTKRGDRKYKVDFPGVGQEGCRESEIELCQ